MKKRDDHNTVDVKVGAFLKQWVINVYGEGPIKLDRDSNLWSIIKQHLDLRPNDYRPIENREEYITFILLKDSSNTKAYRAATSPYDRSEYRVHTLYRCILSQRGENIVKRFLSKQFKNAFHNYMRGAMNNNPDISITEAITEFLSDSCQPVIDNKIISTLSKDWYRYRQKYPDEFRIPIFF